MLSLLPVLTSIATLSWTENLADTLLDALVGGLDAFYLWGNALWSAMISLIGLTAIQQPSGFSITAWMFVRFDIWPLTSAVGATMLNLFFFVGIIRQTTNLRQNMTTEIVVETGIKAVLANAFLLSGISLMRWCFSLSATMTDAVLDLDTVSFAMDDLTVSAVFFYVIFGIIYFAVCLVCSAMVFLVVYGRFLHLYLLVATYPLAISTLPGGPGISQTASAWLKHFFAKTFSVVVIVLALTIAAKMCSGATFTSLFSEDGPMQAVQNIFTMITMTAAVKGADTFVRRTFAL